MTAHIIAKIHKVMRSHHGFSRDNNGVWGSYDPRFNFVVKTVEQDEDLKERFLNRLQKVVAQVSVFQNISHRDMDDILDTIGITEEFNFWPCDRRNLNSATGETYLSPAP